MAANPLTYSELEAFERKALVRFTAWETDLLMRVDDVVLAAWAGEQGAATNTPTVANDVEEYPAHDVANIRAMVRSRAAAIRLKNETEAQVRAGKARR